MEEERRQEVTKSELGRADRDPQEKQEGTCLGLEAAVSGALCLRTRGRGVLSGRRLLTATLGPMCLISTSSGLCTGQAVGTELLAATAEKPSASPRRLEGGEQAGQCGRGRRLTDTSSSKAGVAPLCPPN